MSSTFQRESSSARDPLLDSAIRQHFDVDLRKETVSKTKRRREAGDTGSGEDEESPTEEEGVLSPARDKETDTMDDSPIFQTVEKKQVLVNPGNWKKKKGKKKKKTEKSASPNRIGTRSQNNN